MSAPQLELPDAQARADFIECLDQNFCILAGAGAGKTTAITRRISNLAANTEKFEAQLGKNPLSRLLVCAFTNASADELRARALQAISLDRPRNQSDASTDTPPSLLALSKASFCTIHSFCDQILREFGGIIGLREDFEVVKSDQASIVWREAKEKFCQTLPVKSEISPCAKFLQRLLRKNKSIKPELLAVSAYVKNRKILELSYDLKLSEAIGILNNIEIRSSPITAPKVKLTESLRFDPGRAKAIVNAQRLLKSWLQNQHNNLIPNPLPQFDKSIFKSKAGSEFQKLLTVELKEFEAWLGEKSALCAAHFAFNFFCWRVEKGIITHNDQIQIAKVLLLDDEILHVLRRREYLILLDEAQDTESDAMAIFTDLALELNAPRFSWQEADIQCVNFRTGAFCLVGDDQQAIYGDRSDPVKFAQYIKFFQKSTGKQALRFTATMRCAMKVAERVNTALSGSRSLDGAVQFRDLLALPNSSSGVVIGVNLDTSDYGKNLAGKKLPIYESFAIEAEALAKILLSMKKSGKWGKIAALCPRKAWLGQIEAVLREQGLKVKYRSQTLARRQDRRWSLLICAMYLRARPWDDFELFDFVREIFGVSESDILHAKYVAERVFFAGGKSFASIWQILQIISKNNDEIDEKRPAKFDKKLLIFLSELARGHETLYGEGETQATGAVSLLKNTEKEWRVFERARLDDDAKCLPLSDEAFWQWWLAQAQQADFKAMGVDEWLFSEAALADLPIDDVELFLNEKDGEHDFDVELLTCHKAKGLEWDTVILPGCSRSIMRRAKGFPLVDFACGKKALAFYSTPLTFAELRREQEAQNLGGELQRLLYVALSRARKNLVLFDAANLHRSRKNAFDTLSKNLFADLDKVSVEDFTNGKIRYGKTDEDKGLRQGQKQLAKSETVEFFDADNGSKSMQVCERGDFFGRVHPWRRIFPHQLAEYGDEVSVTGSSRHEQAVLFEELFAGGTDSLTSAGQEDLSKVAFYAGVDYGNAFHQAVADFLRPFASNADKICGVDFDLRIENFCGAVDEAWSGFDKGMRTRLREELMALFSDDFFRLSLERVGERGGAILPEVSISYLSEGKQVEGAIDLLLLDEASACWTLIDWKTNIYDFTEKGAEAANVAVHEFFAGKFERQLRAYAEFVDYFLKKRNDGKNWQGQKYIYATHLPRGRSGARSGLWLHM